MAPKYRGGSDEWLDENSPASKRKARLAKEKSAIILPTEEANATVTEVYPNQCRVRTDQGHELVCNYRRAAVIGSKKANERERAPVAVGDRVKTSETGPSSGVVLALCERRNQLSRPAPGSADAEQVKKFQVIASNLDILVIVTAVKSPDFSPGLVDRFLVAAQANGIVPYLCVNKNELTPPGKPPWEIYQEIGLEVFPVSAKLGTGIEELRSKLIGKMAAFCGHSGVGKTSLLTALTGSSIGRVGEISESTGKGQHTTTSAIMIRGPEGSFWIDTPGVREFGLRGVEPEGLKDFYPEFAKVACLQIECLHAGEPGCGAIGLPRHGSYLRILESLRRGEH